MESALPEPSPNPERSAGSKPKEIIATPPAATKMSSKLMEHARHRLDKMRRTGEISEMRADESNTISMWKNKTDRFLARSQRVL